MGESGEEEGSLDHVEEGMAGNKSVKKNFGRDFVEEKRRKQRGRPS